MSDTMKKIDKNEAVNKLAKLLNNMQHSADEVKRAACNGAEAIMLAVSNSEDKSSPYGNLYDQFLLCSNDSDRVKFLERLTLKYLSDANEEELKHASYIFEQLGKSPKDLYQALGGMRGIIFKAAKVDDNGFRCDKDGKPAEDIVFRPLPGMKIAPWGVVKHYDKETGALSDTATSNSKPVNAMCITLPESHIVLTVTTVTDTYIVQAGVKADIEEHENMLWRYLCAVWKSAVDDTTGEAYCVRDVVIKAAKDSRHPEFFNNSKLIKMIEAGHAKCLQDIYIGTMEALLEANSAALREASASDINRYLELISLFGRITENEQKKILTDDILDAHLDEKGVHLSGLDDTGKIITGNTNNAANRRAYIYHLGEMVAKKLHSTLVENNPDVHPLRKEIIQAYASTACK